jgi:hypothetical protein
MKDNYHHYIALVMQPWSGIRAEVQGIHWPLRIDTNEIGFMPVYESLEKLRKDYPDCDYHLCKPKPKKGRKQ